MDTDLDNNEEPIFELASECETLFLQQISLLKEQRELNGAKILGNYQQRFAAWASFLGVFAGHNVCLDRRLRCHVDTQELVLRLLEILEKNLFLLFSRNELDTNMDIDESLSQSQQQPGQHKISADSLAAIDEAMKRLDQLGKAIRSSPMTSQVIKAKNYAARFDTTSFEEIAQFALRSLYPEASQTLVEQLSQSMLDTYVQFLYRQARKDPLRARRQAQKQLSTIVEGDDEMKVVSPIAETSDPKHLGKAPMVKLRRQGAELLSEYAPTSLDSREAQRKWKKGHPSLHRERKTKSLMSRQVAYPQMGKNSLTCEWCFTPISEEEAKGDEWIQHINADHKPYVCISEACAETSPRYASSSEWLKHMIDSHGRSWHKIVHPTVSWACPICEANVILPRPQDLTAHMQEAHDGVFSGTQIQAIVQQSKVATTRSAEICPICSLSMVDKEETLSKKRGAHALMPEDSNLTVVPVSFKRPRKDEAFGPREHPRSPQPVPDGYTTGEPADPVFNAPKSELIGKHIAGHLQSIMLLTLRLMSVGNETDSSALESDAESDAADLGQANSDSGTNASERSLPESSQSDSMSLDIDSLQKRAELVPDSHEEWDDMQTGRNGPTEDDPFMQQAVASGAFQSYEDTTQSTRFDEASFSGEALDNDPDVWGYLIPIDNQSTDAIILRRHQKSPTLETGKREPLSQRAHGYLIGRHQECDIIVKDPTVSNRHCIIFSKNVGSSNIAVLEDVSTNGTFVNDAIVGRNQSRVLQDRDEVAIMARARFLFRYPKNQAANSFDQQYMLLEELGRGHFAEVFLCVEKSTGQRYAVKIFNKTAGTKHHGLPEGLEGEIGMLMAVSHPNILCIKDAFHADKESRIHMVMELAPEGELFNYIDMNQKLDETKAHDVFTQLFNGVKYLHDRNIVHRDIKPENILLMDKKPNIKLADFNLAKIIGEESWTTTLCGTPGYVAPEILAEGKSRKYTKAVDIWSMGVVLYICLCGFPPFSDELYSRDFPYTLSQQIKSGRFDYPSPYWDSVGDGALDLIDSMLVVDPEKRLTIDQCIAHPWTQGLTPHKTDWTSSVIGALVGLGIERRGPIRERTLLSTLNSVDITADLKTGEDKNPVQIFTKNQSKPWDDPDMPGPAPQQPGDD